MTEILWIGLQLGLGLILAPFVFLLVCFIALYTIVAVSVFLRWLDRKVTGGDKR